MARPLARRLDGSRRIHLDDIDPADTQGIEKDEGLKRLEKLGRELSELENLLTYAGTNGLLVILQGRDASGKDGAIRKILEFTNVQQAYVQPFKVPTEEERAHDFLWRVHRAVPRRGSMALFNRSHYEDVLAARVHKLVP
ncbi:MAG TPA: polyphosphate kinase 2 family protein, partial [Burkholderiales bacterium]|nr:polyphosphate kinase 2 family protein [Burkholderiales bacterium]